jgi:hypothetical protein
MESDTAKDLLVDAIRQGDLLQILVIFFAFVAVGLGFFVWKQYTNAREDAQRNIEFMLSMRDAITELTAAIEHAMVKPRRRKEDPEEE